MDIEFIADDPRRKARPILDRVLNNGVDQLAIACAFCTGAGIELLTRHVSRLRGANSFVVVAAAEPTDYVGLDRLNRLMPGNLFVHWGAMAPVETANGAPLMHSKVFYARAGTECWLWTGSHNLTGNATQGANCEAAILLHGSSDEKPFRDALEHLETCRSWATLYDPDAPPPGSAQKADILVIHAESDPVGSNTLPWHVHLCLDSPEFDKIIRTATNVRLILYPRGSLANGWQGADPFGAYSGALTGLNFTARNRNSQGGGTVAEWNAATLSICEVGGVLSLEPARPLGPRVTTQAVMFFNASVALDELLFAEEPKVKKELITGTRSLMPVDSDMVKYYSKKDVLGLNLKVIPFVGKKQIIQVGEKDVRPADLDRIRMNFGTENDFDIEISSLSVAREMKRHPFIVRAKFRLPEKKANESWLLE